MDWLRRFMYGRYGVDRLAIALLVLNILLDIIAGLLAFRPLRFVALAILAIAVYRIFSRNISARYAENQKFLAYYNPAAAWVRTKWSMLQSMRTHKFFRCPACSQKLRVPRGKGRISVTCTKCRTTFIGKS